MKIYRFFYLLILSILPINASALIEVDITRGNLNPLPIAVSPLSIDENSQKNFERSADKILSDSLEALVGAIYLDGGLKCSEKFILNFWENFIDKSVVTLIDPKTKLQEYSLKKFKKLPKYIFFKKSGPQHKPIFKTEVEVPEAKKIIGTGTSKKNAQQNAAEKLIKFLNI